MPSAAREAREPAAARGRLRPRRTFRHILAGGALLLSLDLALADDIRVHGATTVTFGVMKPKQAAIERQAGSKLVVLPSSTTHGLADLARGKADIAMLAEPLEAAAAAVNGQSPGLIDTDDYVGRHVGDASVEFIVHPNNPLRTLSKRQLAALYSGEIRNWAQIGGQDLPVLLVVEPTSSPYRMIKAALEIAYAPDARVIQNTNQAAIIVAQAPGALGNVSTAHDVPERGRFRVIATELKLALPLYLAYRKDAAEAVKRVVTAAAEARSR